MSLVGRVSWPLTNEQQAVANALGIVLWIGRLALLLSWLGPSDYVAKVCGTAVYVSLATLAHRFVFMTKPKPREPVPIALIYGRGLLFESYLAGLLVRSI